MSPVHCKDVSIREVDFPLEEGIIRRKIEGKKAYTRSDYIVLKKGEQVSVVKLFKGRKKNLFQPILDFELISLPRDTVYLEDDEIDVLNLSHLARVASNYPGKTVVVKGMFEHVSFLKDVAPIHLRVLDVVPPRPSKVSVLVEKALDSGFIDFPIVPQVENIEIGELAERFETEGVVFPCESSDINSSKKVFFLDKKPEIDVESGMVGCSLSKRIFNSLYGGDIDMVNMCPWDLAPRDGVPTIVKCCKVKSGHLIDENVIVVQWGASVREVTEAINSYFGGCP